MNQAPFGMRIAQCQHCDADNVVSRYDFSHGIEYVCCACGKITKMQQTRIDGFPMMVTSNYSESSKKLSSEFRDGVLNRICSQPGVDNSGRKFG